MRCALRPHATYSSPRNAELEGTRAPKTLSTGQQSKAEQEKPRVLPAAWWGMLRVCTLGSSGVGTGTQDWAGADPRKRMRRFFETLYGCLARGARAVLQMYPEDAAQAQALTAAAMRAGFSGGLVRSLRTLPITFHEAVGYWMQGVTLHMKTGSSS